MLTYDPIAQLRHYPVSMRKYGLNPYGEPLYRIVFAPSRRYLVCGEWPDGSNCAHWIVKHKNLGNLWIMEKWIPGERYAGCSREVWNQNNLILGPFPDRGEYELCHVFEACGPEDCNLEKLVSVIELRHTPAEIRAWHQKDAEKEAKATRQTAEDMIRNRLPAYGGRAISSSRVSRSFKTAPLLLTAQEAGLPTKPGMRTKPNKPLVAA